MDFLPGGPRISGDLVQRCCIEIFHRGLANRSSNGSCASVANRCSDIDIVSVLAGPSGPEIMCQNFDSTHKPPLTHCLGSLAGIIFLFFLG